MDKPESWIKGYIRGLRAWLTVMPFLFITKNSIALPVGPECIEGITSINTLPDNSNHQVIIQDKPKAIINWQDFSIAAGQTTEFQQPSPNAIVLNRVISDNVSSIQGSLKANGQVWLINPSGILFGPNSRVDVGGLLATTSNISNADFLNSKQKYHFQPVHSGNVKILNEGQIKVKDSGLVALVGPTVQNSGVIEAHMGKIILGAGSEFTVEHTVDLYGDNLIYFSMGSSDLPIESEGISQTKNAKIIADGGTVLLTASDALKVVDNVINMEGFIQANTVKSKKGTIILSASGSQNPNHKKNLIKVSGEMQATGLKPNEKGGNIKISAEHIGIFENATINVSGDIKGGKIHIGGEKQGEGTLPHADAVFVSQNASIIADAKTMGKGGEIIVLSDNCTRCYGNLSAKGGTLGGDGGFIETSGAWIDVNGAHINASSSGGGNGAWWLDPYNVVVSSSPSGGSFVGNVWIPTANDSNVPDSSIVTRLNANNDVTITTTGAGSQAGNITVSNAISVDLAGAAPTALNLNADGSIAMDASISRVNLPNGTFNVNFNAAGGNVTLNAALDLVSDTPATGGTASFTTQGLTGAGIVTVSALTLVAQNANFVGTVNGLTDGSNIGGMTESLALYGPNFSGSSRYFFNGNEFFITQIPPPPPPPTPIPIPTPALPPVITVPANAIIPALDLFITDVPPSVGDEANIIEIDFSMSSLSISDITIRTRSKDTTTKTTPKANTETTTKTASSATTAPSSASTNTPTVPSVTPIAPTANTPIAPLPVAPPLPTTGPIPPGYDVPIGGILEPVMNFTTEIPITNIEDKAGIPNLSVERTVFDKTVVKPAVVVPISNSVGPTGVNGTDMAIGTAGIGGGIQEPMVHKAAPTVFKKAEEVIGASSDEESIPNVPCPEAPNCIPGVDSLNNYYSVLH